MKRFHFKLDVLLDLKRRAEEEVKKDLARKNGEIVSCRRERADLASRLTSLFAEEKQQRLTTLDLRALKFSIAYRSQLQKEIVRKEQCLSGLLAEREQLRLLLAHARKETRVLEILKEKKFSQWKKEYKMEEQEFVDDVSQKGYVRRLNATSRRAESGIVPA
jgi:flagellar FliJ protein